MNDFLLLVATPIAILIFNVVALGVSFMLIYVITQAENDWHLRRTDRPQVQLSRKRAFYGGAGYLFLIVCFQKFWLYQPTALGVAIVFSGALGGAVWILTINKISLRERQPGPDQGGASPVSSRLRPARIWRRT